MRVMVMVKATQDSEAGVMPSEQLLSEMGRFNEELVKAGIMLSGDGLHPSSKGARVRFSGENRTVIDGPFAETKELVAGFWIWQVSSMAEAIEWVKHCPNPMSVESDIEIRQIFSPEDFGEAYTPELQQHEERLRAELEKSQLDPPRFETGRAMRIAGLSDHYTMQTRANIPAQWSRFAPWLGKVPGQIGKASYGVCLNFNDGGFDYLSGVEVNERASLPKELSDSRLPSQRYAVFTHRKHVSLIGDTIESIWKKWLPNSGHQAAESPALERYSEDFDPRSGVGGIEIWIPIQA